MRPQKTAMPKYTFLGSRFDSCIPFMGSFTKSMGQVFTEISETTKLVRMAKTHVL